MNELIIPAMALEDEHSIEMLRVWIAAKELHCSLKIGMYEETTEIPEARAWGMILADAARHIADALEGGYNKNYDDTLQAIRQCFNEEMAKPTSTMRGDFVKEH